MRFSRATLQKHENIGKTALNRAAASTRAGFQRPVGYGMKKPDQYGSSLAQRRDCAAQDIDSMIQIQGE
jgi:hypothetical protein